MDQKEPKFEQYFQPLAINFLIGFLLFVIFGNGLVAATPVAILGVVGVILWLTRIVDRKHYALLIPIVGVVLGVLVASQASAPLELGDHSVVWLLLFILYS